MPMIKFDFEHTNASELTFGEIKAVKKIAGLWLNEHIRVTVDSTSPVRVYVGKRGFEPIRFTVNPDGTVAFAEKDVSPNHAFGEWEPLPLTNELKKGKK